MIDHTSEIKSPANNEYNLEVNNPDNIVDHKNVTIRSLEEKLRLLDEEKLDLESQIYAAEKKYHEQLDSYLARYINADFSLAQMEYILLHEATKEAQNKYRQSNDDMLAWRFSPERQLLNANEELGRVNQADRVARLESEAELQATCMKEFIKANEDIEGVLEEAYTDLEGLQSSLLILQQQINQTESVVETLQNELESRQPGIVAELMTAMLSKFSETETEVGDGEDDNCKPTLEVHVQSEQDNVENDIDDAKREETCPEEK
ncbi:Pre-mRNA-splicing regulator female-lethal(2)D [Schistosoma japonicum]|nr:Pre-mRNA-splicing regulator female-lethal(2)D [Schistosoma japonicum]